MKRSSFSLVPHHRRLVWVHLPTLLSNNGPVLQSHWDFAYEPWVGQRVSGGRSNLTFGPMRLLEVVCGRFLVIVLINRLFHTGCKNQLFFVVDHFLLICSYVSLRWALWYFKNDKSKSWTDNLRLISKFATVEDFWA